MRGHPLSEPWLITPEGLQLVVAVATRGRRFPAALARARADYGEQGPTGNRAQQPARYKVMEGVAVVGVRGPLARHAGMMDRLSGGTSYSAILEALEAALSDNQVRAILLQLDTPGGEANGCYQAGEELRAVAQRKPLVAFADERACSAGYWLASGASKVLCTPTSILGSIGVRMCLMDDAKRQEMEGVREVEIISSQSPGKRGSPLDDELLARVQKRCDDLADIFIETVARNRGVSVEKVTSDYGQGDVLMGAAAVKAGLADGLATFSEALAQARALATPKTSGGGPSRPLATDRPTGRGPARSTNMSKTLGARLDALATREDLAEGTRQELAGLAKEAVKLEADVFAAKAEAVNATARAEKAEYEQLLRDAQEPTRDASGKTVAGPKITGPAHLERVRSTFTTAADLSRYLAVTDPAPAIAAPQPKGGPGSGASIELQNAIGNAMGYPTGGAS